MLILQGPAPNVQATSAAFAAILADESVVTWGDPHFGGDNSAVQEQLKGVQHVQKTLAAFAAILSEGSVVTWGSPPYGGDSSSVRHQLKHVQHVQATDPSFAAILADGSVVTWGDPRAGGYSSAVGDHFRSVRQVQATSAAFAVILTDGSVVTWGNPDSGGDSSAVLHQLKNAQQVQANRFAFAATLADGSVVTWGDPGSGGDSSCVQDLDVENTSRSNFYPLVWGLVAALSLISTKVLPPLSLTDCGTISMLYSNIHCFLDMNICHRSFCLRRWDLVAILENKKTLGSRAAGHVGGRVNQYLYSEGPLRAPSYSHITSYPSLNLSLHQTGEFN